MCQEAGVSARVARSLWRDALRGSLLPFMPVYSKAGDLNDMPEHCLVRRDTRAARDALFLPQQAAARWP